MAKITAFDRLIFTLIFSIIVHLTIVLGVSFDATSPLTNQPLVNLDITLVKEQTALIPEQADFLAQANNEGGGETDEKEPEPSPEHPKPIAPIPPAIEQTVKSIEPTLSEIKQSEPETSQPIAMPVKPAPVNEPKKIITQAKAERKVQTTTDASEDNKAAEVNEPKPTLSARDLSIPTQTEIAQLQRSLDASIESLSKRPKKRRISARTKQYSAAAYMKAWESKVERIGNFNYPREAKRQGINGSLMLSVDINPDGSVPPNGIVISRSSGYKVLDDAAVKIVRLGAPYAHIPEDVLQGNDMLTIIRTWKFETNRGLSTR